ncbi:MAG: ATP-binding cassette domain-containing protein [Bacteroidetes bacterium]|nr:ATP-binding cassette domain-containing protein [Bacteroidota bacterium]
MVDILQVEQISKRYSNHQALTDITLSVQKQSIFGLLGPNGAGKTTLIRIINQIINSDSGTIFIEGKKLKPDHIEIIGYLPEERGLYKKMKVGEQLIYFAELKGLSPTVAKQRIKAWLKKFDILDWWNKKLEDLSKGMAQKIQFICTVLHEPRLLILDEPFTGFDPVNADLIKNEILELRENGTTIIFSTHRMESVEELCDHIVLINHSRKILDGTKKEIKDKFKSHTFTVTHKGAITSLNGNFELIKQINLELDKFDTTIKIAPGVSPNELLKSLVNNTEVYGFSENIPSMNDIFISIVKEENNE